MNMLLIISLSFRFTETCWSFLAVDVVYVACSNGKRHNQTSIKSPSSATHQPQKIYFISLVLGCLIYKMQDAMLDRRFANNNNYYYMIIISNCKNIRWYLYTNSSRRPIPATSGKLPSCFRNDVTMNSDILLKWHSPTPGAEELVAITEPPLGQSFECHLHQFGSNLLARPSSKGCHDQLMESDKKGYNEWEGVKVWDKKKKSLVLLGNAQC